MYIPPDITLRATIQLGSVYYFHTREFHSENPHFFVVVGIDDHTEDVILVAASSQIDNVKWRNKDNPSSTIVEISPTQYCGFTRPSIFDCNNNVICSKNIQLDFSSRVQATQIRTGNGYEDS